ncbi:MAG: hypothetical protein J0M23_04600 [Rickettsiales bacterium]|nr:hypothetical protein [Rickettsiales bacterium]
MIQIFNKCLHGFILTPVINAFCKNNVFNLLAKSKYSVEDLVNNTNANLGYLGVALNAFESLGWVKKTEIYYQLGEDFPDVVIVPECIIKFYNFKFETYFYKTPRKKIHPFLDNLDIKNCLKFLKNTSFLENDLLSFFLEGAILLPLFFFMKNNLKYLPQDKLVFLDNIPNIYLDQLGQLFLVKKLGTVKSKTLELTNVGAYLINSIQNSGVTLSYRPLLSNIDKLIFDNDPETFKKIKNEKHIDRTLNVIGSGSQHKIFFRDFQILLKNFLAAIPENESPVAIVDMGCGDGSLLKTSYEVVPQKEKITLIGVDFSNDSLKQTSRNLKGLPYKTMHGNIVDPQRLFQDLYSTGFKDINKIIHIRSFLDHNRPYELPKDILKLRDRLPISYYGRYISYNEENIPAHNVVQNLVENFQKWASIVGDFGLITLEVFSLPPYIVKLYLEETESLHFDTYHGFSKQLLVEAHVYMMAAAEAGLIPNKKNFRKYPALLPYTRISLQHFFPKSFIIRHPCLTDINKLINMQTIEGSPLSLSSKEIRHFLNKYPEEQYIIEKDKEIACAIYTQRIIEGNLYMNKNTIKEIYSPHGEIIILVCFQVNPLYQELIHDLLSFVIHNSFIKNGIKKVITLMKWKDSDTEVLNQCSGIKTDIQKFSNPLIKINYKQGAKIEKIVESNIRRENKISYMSYNYLDWVNNN